MKYIFVIVLSLLLYITLQCLPTYAVTLPLKWSMIAVLLLLLPGIPLIDLLGIEASDVVEAVAVIMGLSLVLTSALSLILSATALSSYFLLVVIMFNCLTSIHGMLKENKSELISIASQVQYHRLLILLVVFLVAVHLSVYLRFYSESIISDVDMWIVLEIGDGGLLQSYVSIWHYLGLAPYSYPPLFHAFSANVRESVHLLPSQLFPLILMFSLIPMLFIYCLVKDIAGKRAALVSVLILATTPIFIYNTLPATFKARAMFYGFLAIELYALNKGLRGKRSWWILFFSAFLASLFAYREAILINFFVSVLIFSYFLKRSSRRVVRWGGLFLSCFGAMVFALAYVDYTPSLGLLETLLSSSMKFGPLLFFSIIGIIKVARRGDSILILLSTLASSSLIISFVSWKAAETAPLLLAPFTGIGLLYLMFLLQEYRRPLHWRKIMLVLFFISILTISIGVSYYPQKYYVKESGLYDETTAIHGFLTDRVQRGALVYGTGYTGIDLGEDYASMIVLGPQQKPLAEAYAIQYLTSRMNDTWVLQHPETIYESTYQLYHSLYSHHNESLTQFLRIFCIQFLVLEKNIETSNWVADNRQMLQLTFTTNHYAVYEVSPTRSEVELFHFIEEDLPKEARIISPAYLSPFVRQLREDFLSTQLESVFRFDYFYLLQRMAGYDESEKIEKLQTRLSLLKEIYSYPDPFEKLPSTEKFDYIIIDKKSSDGSSIFSGHEKSVFSNSQFEILQLDKMRVRDATDKEDEREKPPSVHPLVVNTYATEYYTERRYSLDQPLSNVSIRIFREGKTVQESLTDSSGSSIILLPEGEYTIVASLRQKAIEKHILLDAYTFLPIMIPQKRENPTDSLVTPLTIMMAILTLLLQIRGRKDFREPMEI